MPETLLEMTKELVLAQIQAKQVMPETLSTALRGTHATLARLHAAEAGSADQPDADLKAGGSTANPSVDWKSSITKHAIRCLECGATFRQLSRRHLDKHGLNPRSYRHKYGMPLEQALSAREVTVRRRQLAKDIRPWEQARTAKLAPKRS